MVAYVLIGLAAVVLATFVVREVSRRRQTRSLRDVLDGQPIRFQTPVLIKRDSAPRWALGARGFTLVVRPGSFAVAGPGESQSWYFQANESSVEWSQESGRDWIVVTGSDSAKPVHLRLRPAQKARLWESWSALVSEGATPLTDPPLTG